MTASGPADTVRQNITPAKKMAGSAALILTVAGLAASLFWGIPFLMWAYYVQQAGAYMERGMAWPDERHSDSLPQTLDSGALETAFAYLERAQAVRPRHFHAFRMEGNVFLALGSWLQAEPAFAASVARAPGNPLVRFDQVILYEQMMLELGKDAGHQLWSQVKAQPSLLSHPAFSEVCVDPTGRWACSYIYIQVSLPLADLPWEAPMLGIKGTQHVDVALKLPSDAEALAYLLAVWPQPGQDLDGPHIAHLQIKGENDAEFTTLDNLDLSDPAMQGKWLPRVVSLAPWIGQTVTLRLEASSQDHFIGWGQLTMAKSDIAGMTSRTPRLRWEMALRAGGFESSDTLALATEAQNVGNEEQHAAWQQRSALLESVGR